MFESVIHNFAARSVVTFTLTTIMTWGLSEFWNLYLSLKFATLGLHSHNPTIIYKSGFTPSSCQAIDESPCHYHLLFSQSRYLPKEPQVEQYLRWYQSKGPHKSIFQLLLNIRNKKTKLISQSRRLKFSELNKALQGLTQEGESNSADAHFALAHKILHNKQIP